MDNTWISFACSFSSRITSTGTANPPSVFKAITFVANAFLANFLDHTQVTNKTPIKKKLLPADQNHY